MNYYDVLGVSKTATKEEIISAYRAKSLILHPDMATGNNESFLELVGAKNILTDDKYRKMYDVYGTIDSVIIEKSKAEFVHIFKQTISENPLTSDIISVVIKNVKSMIRSSNATISYINEQIDILKSVVAKISSNYDENIIIDSIMADIANHEMSLRIHEAYVSVLKSVITLAGNYKFIPDVIDDWGKTSNPNEWSAC